MTQRKYQHLFPIIDEMINVAIKESEDEGEPISCRKGCDHCCHLLIEVSWEEASEAVYWLAEQPVEKREEIEQRIRENARDAKELFLSNKKSRVFATPFVGDVDLPDETYDSYFYDKVRPCPFLEKGTCIAYDVRPTPCRLHMVTSDPALCANDVKDDDDYEVSDPIEELREEAAPVINALEKDGRWGHFAIVMEEVISELRENGEYPAAEKTNPDSSAVEPSQIATGT